ncbi:hypothetical protein [Niabella hibiscisoli]|uniref:hypothetical protein n=1 Tax=Niabella hibiscisoli TaxID=1825928 RepID=UPI001F10D3B8|nr:hypothetical protein [Niabella hibiscisoli]MCH5720498.1 hypothetical protein [Niabella hibiscisoli]
MIEKLFKENQPRELATAIDEFCIAALTEGYAWRQGSPANALQLGKNIELLMEIAWLLHPKRDKNLIKKLPYQLQLSTNLLPMPLNAAEYWQPELFLSRFFQYQSLLQWKQLLICFTENAIGSGSVAEELHSPELLNFNLYLKKLVYAVYCLGLGERDN